MVFHMREVPKTPDDCGKHLFKVGHLNCQCGEFPQAVEEDGFGVGCVGTSYLFSWKTFTSVSDHFRPPFLVFSLLITGGSFTKLSLKSTPFSARFLSASVRN